MNVDAAALLRRCGMPEVEIGWVLGTGDPATVHMIVELHRERLEEELAERTRAMEDVEAWLARSAPSQSWSGALTSVLISPCAAAEPDRPPPRPRRT